MLTHDSEPAPALPAPAPLPSLTSALSRRAAIFGTVAAGSLWTAGNIAVAVAAAAVPALDPADARLVALADAYAALDRKVNATLSTAPGYDALVDGYCTIEDELVSTQAATMAGVLAKAQVMQFSACRDCNGADVGVSIADDLVRLHAEGRLS